MASAKVAKLKRFSLSKKEPKAQTTNSVGDDKNHYKLSDLEILKTIGEWADSCVDEMWERRWWREKQ